MIRRFFGARIFGYLGLPSTGAPPGTEFILTETSENLRTETAEDLLIEG